MKKFLSIAAVMLASTLPASAQNWSFGAATGPFVFGDFVERRIRVGNEQGTSETVLILGAATRAGLAVDLERSFSERWAVRLEGTFTRAPLSLEADSDGEGAEINQGELDVSTFMLPLIFRINPNGAFRFHLLGGPAAAIYRATAEEGEDPVFAGTEIEWGFAFGGGVAWWLSDRFALEGNITDTITGSPFEEEDFAGTPRIDIKRPHNVHTTVGLRWRF